MAEGPGKGKRISEIYPGEFPLLIKFIDARRDLSIQVHPDDELAAKRHGCKGKTEMWYVIDAAAEAKLLSGLCRRITPDDYVRLVGEDRITEALASYNVSAGDVFFLPAGRIHAIGGGCHIAEIQQTSDITYRIYDYNRPGLDGKPRQLHTEQAKDAIDYTLLPDYRTHYEHRPDSAVEIVRCPFFTTSLLELSKSLDFASEAEFTILICTEGEAQLEGNDAGSCTTLHAGEAALVLGDKSVRITPSGFARLLATHA